MGRCVINSSFSQFHCLSGIPVVRCSFIILPLMTTCYQSQNSFLTLSCLIMNRSSFRSSTMSNCLGSAWGACDKWRLTNEDFEVSRLKAINNKPDNLCKQDGGEAPMWSTRGRKKHRMSARWDCAGACLRFQRLSSMFQRCRLKEDGACGRGKCAERFFYKGLVGLKGSSDKASKPISLCQDLHCGENGIITDKRR